MAHNFRKISQSLCSINRVVNRLVPVWVHGGPGTRTIKENVESDPDSELFRNQFLSSGTGTRTIYGKGLDPDPGLGRE